MNQIMSNPRQCTQCEAELSPTVPRGLCGRCLIALGLESGLAKTDIPPHELDKVREVLRDMESDPEKTTIAPPLDSTAVFPPKPTEAAQMALGRFGDYLLLEEIARGGMGVVYRARQTGLDRIVAVKMILAGQFASKQLIQRFRGEVTAAALLKHPNIVAIHEVGIHEGQHFFSMDYIEGQNLAQLVGNRALPAQQAARYLKLIAEAIHYAHQQGILHRDLKPSNILIDSATDQPRVTDFGLAKRLDGESSLTATGQMLGSPNFMPPEQASAKHGKVGRHSDVYGLGGILYFLLTARPPFQAESLEGIVTQVLGAEPVSPRLLNSSIPRDLETICVKCLQKDSTHRYQTAQELADELDRFLRDEPILARPATRAERPWRWCRRKPLLAGLSAALALALVVGSTVVVWQSAALKKQLIETRRSLYAQNLIVVHQDLENGNYEKAQDLLKTHLPKSGVEELRGFEWRYLWQLSQGEQLSVLGRCTSSIVSVAVSPDGKFIASANEGSAAVKVWDLPAHREVQALTEHTAPVNYVVFSPDGETLASGSDDHTIKLWDTQTWRLKASLERHIKAVITVAFSGDGRVMASSSHDLSVILWDTATGRERTTLTNISRWPGPIALSTDGGTLIFADHNVIKVWDVEKGKLKLELPSNEPFGINTIALSPDGRTLAAGHGNGAVTMIWDLAQQGGELPTPKRLERTSRPAFSPDSQWLAVGTADTGRIELWDLQTWTRQSTLRGHPPGIESIVFSPDGKSVISGGDKTIRIWPAGAQKERDVFRGHRNYVWSVAFSPDGNTLASGSWDSSVRLWDVRTGQLKEVLKTTHPVYGVAFSPDGRILASAGGVEVSPNGPGEVRLWDLLERREIAAFKAHDAVVHKIAFAPDGTRLATASGDGTIKLWDAATRSELTTLIGHVALVGNVEFSHDGTMVASGSADWTARLWDVKSGKQLAILTGHSGPAGVAFAPDDKTLVTQSWDMTLKIWDVATHKEKVTLRGHSATPMAMTFCSDARTFATSGWDGVIKLWNVISQREVATLKPQSLGVMSLAFSRDGRILAAGSVDGSIHLWRGASLAEIEQQIESVKEAK